MFFATSFKMLGPSYFVACTIYLFFKKRTICCAKLPKKNSKVLLNKKGSKERQGVSTPH